MSRIFLAPSKYVQGPDSISSIGEYVLELGNKPMILSGKTAWSECNENVSKSLDAKGISFHMEFFGGECCEDEIKRLSDICKTAQLDILIAIIILFKPYKYIVVWMVLWAFSTALIRPLSGEPIWAFIERGANWGAPLALYCLLRINSK